MNVLFIGGTGNISASVSRLCVARGVDLTLLNRATRGVEIRGATMLVGDITHPEEVQSLLRDRRWDAVVDWIAYTEQDVERDLNLFRGRVGQFMFISSASAYQKPPASPIITESTLLSNPYWQYSRDKIAGEERLLRAWRDEQFPVTIVRPSLTYDTVIPVPIGGWTEYTVVDRIKRGKPVIVHGDGTSLWTITHAQDFAKGCVGLLGNPEAIGQSFHITSDEILTWNQVYRSLAAAAGCEPAIVHIPSDFLVQCEHSLEGTLQGDKAVSVVFDNSKIKSFVPGFKATIPFSEGIRSTIAWFEARPDRMVVRPETNAMIDRILQSYGHGEFQKPAR